jgi:hypothetical protein
VSQAYGYAGTQFLLRPLPYLTPPALLGIFTFKKGFLLPTKHVFNLRPLLI